MTVEPAIIDDSVPTEDEIAAAVKKAAEKQVGGAIADSRGAHQRVARGALISEETWKLVDERVTMRRKARDRTGMRRLGRSIQASLKGDRRRRVEETGSAVESLLKEDPPNAKETWQRMKGWYQAAAKRGPPPARATLERITAERTEL